jgi:hypothetical protein
MFTTAGSTRLTIAEKEFDDGTGSGNAKGAAFVPANEKVLIAETLPETSVPMKMPITKVAAIDTVAINFRRRVQSPMFFTWSIFHTPI